MAGRSERWACAEAGLDERLQWAAAALGRALACGMSGRGSCKLGVVGSSSGGQGWTIDGAG